MRAEPLFYSVEIAISINQVVPIENELTFVAKRGDPEMMATILFEEIFKGQQEPLDFVKAQGERAFIPPRFVPQS